MVLDLVISSLFFFSREYIGNLFTSSQEVINIVASLVTILIAYQFGDALQIVYANALRGIGDVYSMAIISFIGYFIIAIPVSYICGFTLDWGIQGIWMGYPIGLTLTGIMLWLRFQYSIKGMRLRK